MGSWNDSWFPPKYHSGQHRLEVIDLIGNAKEIDGCVNQGEKNVRFLAIASWFTQYSVENAKFAGQASFMNQEAWGHFQDSDSELHRESLGHSTDAPALFYKDWQQTYNVNRNLMGENMTKCHRTGTL